MYRTYVVCQQIKAEGGRGWRKGNCACEAVKLVSSVCSEGSESLVGELTGSRLNQWADGQGRVKILRKKAVLRIRIRFRTDPHSLWSGGPILPSKVKKFQAFKCQMFSFEGWWLLLELRRPLWRPIWISKFQLLIKKYFSFSWKFFPIFGHQNPGSGSGYWSGSALTKIAGSGSVFGSADQQHWKKRQKPLLRV